MNQKLFVHTLSGPNLDASEGRRLLAEAKRQAEAGVEHLVLDFSRVRFMDSLGVAALASLRRTLPGLRVVLAGLSSYLSTLARATRLVELFEVFADAGAALRALA